MKKILSLILALVLAVFAVCALAEEAAVEEEEVTEVPLMTYADYALAEIDAPVYVETYVQAHQSWWNDKITIYVPEGRVDAYKSADYWSDYADRITAIQE